MSGMSETKAYIIAACRTALGRVGGLHARRRLEDLAAPVITSLLNDTGVSGEFLDEVIVGNASAGGNPARLIALASRLPEAVVATTVDQQDASGLAAILHGVRLVGNGDAECVIAGGAESLSTAPWRVSRPRNIQQTPYFISPQQSHCDLANAPVGIETTERLARRFNISRARQDVYAWNSYERALEARRGKRFQDEIVPLRANSKEARDQSTVEHDLDDFSEEEPFLEKAGTLTPANISSWHDGAAFVLIASEALWKTLGTPPALTLVANAGLGVGVDDEAAAPIAAVNKLYQRLNGFDRSHIGIVETSETSAVQAIAMAEALDISDAAINPEGGAISRGYPFGAAGAVLVVRLFSQLVRHATAETSRYGIAAQGASGGLGTAALFGSITHCHPRLQS